MKDMEEDTIEEVDGRPGTIVANSLFVWLTKSWQVWSP
jgi:hypothetical protein